MEIEKQLEKVEALRCAYEAILEEEDANSHKAIQAFYRWHTSAVEFFADVLGVEDQLLQKFQPEGLAGNGYVLNRVYHSILSTYTVMKVKAKNMEAPQEITDKIKIEEKRKSKKIFISHSSRDAEFVKALVHLLLLMGFDEKEIFCSSVPGFWVGDGEDFFDVIKKHFEEYELYVIFIHSPRFYDSHISLNEMGAAWVLHSEYSSFLTADMSFGQMDAVVPNTKVAVKVNGDEVEGRMNDWKRRILDWFGKKPINDNIWELIRKDFLEKVSNLIVPSNSKNPEENDKQLSKGLTKEDEERLKIWVDSEDNTMFQLWYEGDSAVFGLGAKNQYEVKAGREMAEWQGFFKRLLAMDLVEEAGSYQGHPKYQLTENAYTYFEK